MPQKLLDIRGRRFGRLIVLEYITSNRLWLCRCDCGNFSFFLGSALRRGHNKSCGCLKEEILSSEYKIKHGEARKGSISRELRVWRSMHERCYYQRYRCFHRYGGRGVQICMRWHKSNDNGYKNFLSDMGRAPSPKHSIDRINNDGHYMPSNCRWATQKEQMQNSIRVKK